MSRRSLADNLRLLVSRHGMSAVLHTLADVEPIAGPPPPGSDRNSHVPSRVRPTAAACVDRMALTPQKAIAMRRAAELFDDKRFLPAISDIREFSRVHSIDLPKSASRASCISRVFTFIASMDINAIEKILDGGAFSGPTQLAPIADAIRDHSARHRSNKDRPKGVPLPKSEQESETLGPGATL